MGRKEEEGVGGNEGSKIQSTPLCPEVTLESVYSCSQWLMVRNPSIKFGPKAVIFPLEDCPIM